LASERLIKKYPNRRLYDTHLSRYITLNDVQALIREGTDIRVMDSQSGEDLTRNVLIQIITEQESGGSPLFSTDALLRFVRVYDESAKSAFSSFLDQSLEVFAAQQRHFQRQLEEWAPGHPLRSWNEMFEQNLDLWKEMQKGFFGGPLESPASTPKPEPTEPDQT
jgi:polyhydroxyalkanoate synthesis repressor PhaR